MTFCLTPMQPGDYVDATQGRAPWESAWEVACYRLDHGAAWTARVDGAIAGVGGLLRLWPGVGEVWLCVTPVGQQHPVFLVRAMRRCLVAQTRTHGLRRVQADVRDHDTRAVNLVARLGFEEEGIMRCYGPQGEDFIRYARITP